MTNQIIRALLLVASISLACVWSNALLYVSEEATEVVLAKEDLQALLNEPAPEPPPRVEPGIGEAAPAPAPLPEPPPANEQTPPLEQPTLPATVQATEDVIIADKNDQAPLADATDQTDHSPPAEPIAPITSLGENGTLASFDGSGVHGDPRNDGAGQSGQGNGPVWDIQFHGEPTTELLQRIKGARLAAVRHRRGFIEVALIRDGEISLPARVEELLRDHPEFLGRKGIILDRRWLGEVEDRLLNYGGGWQAWLLIEDAMFAEWLNAVNAHVKASQLGWDSIERIEAAARIRRFNAEVRMSFTVRRIHSKPPPETVPVESAPPPEPTS